MLKLNLLTALIFANTFIVCAENHNRVYFNINPEDRRIVFHIQLNDSITANISFDSGAELGCLILDSTFCAIHPNITMNSLLDIKTLAGSAWSSDNAPALIHKKATKIKIGNTDLKYDYMKIYNWKNYMKTSSDGLFNLPANDTTNVWEFNFENSYLEIHQAADFKMPENCFVVPIVKELNNPYPFNIQLPIKVKCADGDTTTLNRTFMIDTGISHDITLMYKADKLPFFSKKSDAIWTKIMGSYCRHYTVDATLINHFALDSLRIYTYNYPNKVNCDYLIGLNFLKRFNVFIDMRNRQVGLQQIKNFQRAVNLKYRRFYFSTNKTSKGNYLVNFIADYKGNYYKTAGLQVGDEIVTVNGTPYKKITYQEEKEFYKQDTLVFDIIRKGISLKIIVQVGKNEIQGD